MFECLAGYLLLIKLSRLTDACLYLFLSLSLSLVRVAVASFFLFLQFYRWPRPTLRSELLCARLKGGYSNKLTFKRRNLEGDEDLDLV